MPPSPSLLSGPGGDYLQGGGGDPYLAPPPELSGSLPGAGTGLPAPLPGARTALPGARPATALPGAELPI